jgi:hypothetical protein
MLAIGLLFGSFEFIQVIWKDVRVWDEQVLLMEALFHSP